MVALIKFEMYKVLFPIMVMFVVHSSWAQTIVIPRDTSFTVQSAYEKSREQYPFIEIARPELPEGVHVRKNVVYRTLGERQLHLDIFYPAGGGKQRYPGVLLIHGGGWRSGSKEHTIPMAQQLAAHGFVAAAVEYRLSLEAPYPAAMHDVKAAIRWLRAHADKYSLDTSKVASYGCSSGGQMAALLGTTNGMEKLEGEGDHPAHSSSVQAAVDVDGILAFKHPESEEGQAAGWWLGGTFEEATNHWIEASPLTHASDNAVPLLFINSALPRFHAGRDDLIRLLDRQGIYSEVHTFPDTPHPFWLFHPWFEPTAEYTIAFLDKVFHQLE